MSKLIQKTSVLVFLGLTWVVQPSWAILHPVREISQLPSPVSEVAVSVPNARVVLADYDLIRRDFSGSNPSLETMTETQIDHWLLSQAGFIARSQFFKTQQSHVNTSIEVDPTSTTHAFRPLHYGRALVFQVEGGGLIDAKGVGALDPSQSSHATGLATLGEVIREFTYEKMVKRVFTHYKNNFKDDSQFDTVGSYAVIDWGFDVLDRKQVHQPAGAILRQAHDRYGDPASAEYNFLPVHSTMELEKVLRKYGISSAGIRLNSQDNFQIADLQGTSECAVVDFGTFLVYRHFAADVQAILDENFTEVLRADSAEFLQPDPSVSLPFEVWGYSGDHDDAKDDRLSKASSQLAQSFRNNKMTASQVKRELRTRFVQPVLDKWAARN